jgi:hypothetical protein
VKNDNGQAPQKEQAQDRRRNALLLVLVINYFLHEINEQ